MKKNFFTRWPTHEKIIFFLEKSCSEALDGICDVPAR